jgi:putative membrane protein
MKEFNRILAFSLIACGFLFWLIYWGPNTGVTSNHEHWSANLSALNALMNFLCACFLIRGFLQIKARKIEQHKKSMKSAFVCSAIFLVSYICYHYFHGDSKFMGEGFIRSVYFFILISHILLSVIALPVILFTFYLGLKSDFEAHKKIARWTFPIWLYVSVTGVLIFFFMKLY